MIVCDTSAIAKFYVPEKETASLTRLLEGDEEVCACELARPELMATFHRRLREGAWSRRDFLAAVRQFEHDDLSGFWTWLPVDGNTLRAAADTFATLPENVFLRSSDCIHLVTALRHRFTEVVTYDVHQTKAAPAVGLTVRRP